MNCKFQMVRFLFLFGGLALLAGCSKGQPPSGAATGANATQAQPKGDVVAKVGESYISLADFEEQLNQQNPLIRARYNSLEQKKKLLENLVQREAMVLEAERLGLDKDPEMLRGYKKILARHLVNTEFNQKRVKELDISDQDIQKYYDENKDRYHAPEKIRLHQIFLAAPKADAAMRKAARATASELLGQLKANAQDRRLFLELARKHSADEATRNVGGDTNFKTREQLTEAYGGAVADAGFGLQKANDLSGPVETDTGFYLLRQAGRQAAIDLPLDKVKGQIRTTLFARMRGDAYQQFVEDIKKKVGVEMYDDVVDKAKVDTSAGADVRKPFPGGMGPGHGVPGQPGPKHPGPGAMLPGGKVAPGAPGDRARVLGGKPGGLIKPKLAPIGGQPPATK